MRFPPTLMMVLLVLSTSARGLAQVKSREFELHYQFSVARSAEPESIRAWIPVPSSNADQDVKVIRCSLDKDEYTIEREPKYGNQILSFDIPAGATPYAFSIDYHVVRREVRGLEDASPRNSTKLSTHDRKLFLGPNLRVPIAGRPLELLPNFQSDLDAMQRARLLYEKVDDHVKYDKSLPGYGRGDVLWVCGSRYGNCTDFHSLFISLARSQAIPARFEIGFPLPLERGAGKIGGYHCWAAFHDGSMGWVPVDISEADKHPEWKDYYFGNLTENRVAFSVGRDIELVPRQRGPALNYFVYPYLEVGGQPLNPKLLDLEFSFRDTLSNHP